MTDLDRVLDAAFSSYRDAVATSGTPQGQPLATDSIVNSLFALVLMDSQRLEMAQAAEQRMAAMASKYDAALAPFLSRLDPEPPPGFEAGSRVADSTRSVSRADLDELLGAAGDALVRLEQLEPAAAKLSPTYIRLAAALERGGLGVRITSARPTHP